MTTSTSSVQTKCPGNGGKGNSRMKSTYVNKKIEKPKSKLWSDCKKAVSRNVQNKSTGDRYDRGEATLAEMTSIPMSLSETPETTYYRVIRLNNLILEKRSRIDLNSIDKKELLVKINKHVRGDQKGRAPTESPFFSVTKSRDYAARFARFLMQNHDVMIICFDSKLEVLDPKPILSIGRYKNYTIGADEYLVANEIPIDRVTEVLIFGQKIFKLRRTNFITEPRERMKNEEARNYLRQQRRQQIQPTQPLLIQQQRRQS